MSDKADNSENVLASTSGQVMVPCHKNWCLSIHLKLFRTTTKLAHSALFPSLPRCYLPLCDATVLPPSDAFLCWQEHWVNGGKYFDAQYPNSEARGLVQSNPCSRRMAHICQSFILAKGCTGWQQKNFRCS